MSLRKEILEKLKFHGIEVSSNNFDDYYWRFRNETKYEFSKFDGFLDLIEDDDFFNKFLSLIEVYIDENKT